MAGWKRCFLFCLVGSPETVPFPNLLFWKYKSRLCLTVLDLTCNVLEIKPNLYGLFEISGRSLIISQLGFGPLCLIGNHSSIPISAIQLWGLFTRMMLRTCLFVCCCFFVVVLRCSHKSCLFDVIFFFSVQFFLGNLLERWRVIHTLQGAMFYQRFADSGRAHFPWHLARHFYNEWQSISSHPYSLLIDNGCSVRHAIGAVYYVLFVWDDVWRALLAWQSDNGNHNILNSSTERLSARLHTS